MRKPGWDFFIAVNERLTCKNKEIGKLCGLQPEEIDPRGRVPRPEAGLGHKAPLVSASEAEQVRTFAKLFYL